MQVYDRLKSAGNIFRWLRSLAIRRFQVQVMCTLIQVPLVRSIELLENVVDEDFRIAGLNLPVHADGSR